MYSSTALSRISQTRWWSPLLSTPPMYMAGRLRTGSSPSRTWMSSVRYAADRVAVSALIGVSTSESKPCLGQGSLFVALPDDPPVRGVDDVMRSAALELWVGEVVIDVPPVGLQPEL